VHYGIKGAIQIHATSKVAANHLQKRNREPETAIEHEVANTEVDTSKPTAVFEANKGRVYTLSVALPGSIIAKLALLPQISKNRTADDLRTVHKRLNYKRF